MPNEMIEIMTSLSLVMREETERLQRRERVLDLAALAAAKARLVAQLEEVLARRNRREPEWQAAMNDETRERLTECLAELRAASIANAALLERQIELSMEMMTAIADEAKRLSGNRSYTYVATGDLARVDAATPISFNGEY
ncbi:flagellar biosynthesis protein FlgN [Novosphingobium sp. BL-8H]|uniref:flagellar biosynthesis protein FlgN n=1 Tax=Novosphingobium sp. BL-8H TaxID=3127640 RepID=UPI00375767BC